MTMSVSRAAPHPRRSDPRLAWLKALVVALASTAALEALPAKFVGAERCRLCHRDVYRSWLETPHARTETVSLGRGECARCHQTSEALGFRGVQCEACHGAGGNYWPPEVMIDPEKAALAGLRTPTESVCRQCHPGNGPPHEATFEMPPRALYPAFVHRVRDP